MKKFFGILLILLAGTAGIIYFVYFRGGKKRDKGPEPVSLSVSKHSDTFNQSVQAMLNEYYDLSEAFVNWDTAKVTAHTNALRTRLNDFKVDELKVDTNGIYESALDPLATAKANADAMANAAGLDAKRTIFNQLSDNIRLLMIVVKYDREKMYWQECPMAFGDESTGNWLSRTADVRNPYLGTKHPEYKATMLECGGPKDTINFTMSTPK